MKQEDFVVVTGMGAVASLGLCVDEIWEKLLSSQKSRDSITLFGTDGCRCRHGAQVPLPAADRSQRRMSRASRLVVKAADEAITQSGLSSLDKKELPISISTTGGAMEWGEAFLRGVLSSRRRRRLSHVAGYQPQQQVLDMRKLLGLDGSCTIFANACASGATAIGHAYDLIQSGAVNRVIAGGYEALTELIFVGFDCLQALSPETCKPFDQERNGLMLGEGAAFFVLEKKSVALQRGAKVLGKVLGYGHATDLHHLTQPSPDGIALMQAIFEAFRVAGTTPDSIAYLNAHGTGTPANDGMEAEVYAKVFGPSLSRLCLSSTKGAIGHTLGAAGAIEAVIALRASQQGKPPPQVGGGNPLPLVASSLVQPGTTIPVGSHVMTTNLGFGGSNAALILSA